MWFFEAKISSFAIQCLNYVIQLNFIMNDAFLPFRHMIADQCILITFYMFRLQVRKTQHGRSTISHPHPTTRLFGFNIFKIQFLMFNFDHLIFVLKFWPYNFVRSILTRVLWGALKRGPCTSSAFKAYNHRSYPKLAYGSMYINMCVR